MDNEILLPNSKYINTNLGLKYLNANKKLYLKVLNSFLERYENFDINNIKKDELRNEMHTLKGLSSTLGMESLSNLAKTLEDEKTKELLFKFSETLTIIIADLNILRTKTILVIDDNSDDIDTLIELLTDNYDIMVMTTPNDELNILSTEKIDIILLNPLLNNLNIKNKLEQENISCIELYKPIDINQLQLDIKNV
jgi:PleD family two-component response regulator